MRRKYTYVRYTWWRDVDVDELERRLSESFTVRPLDLPGDTRYEIGIYKNVRQETLVKADTLGAYVSRFRAVLFQRERAPFTRRDVELRRQLLETYPRDRPSPFPWAFSSEEPFEVAEDDG